MSQRATISSPRTAFRFSSALPETPMMPIASLPEGPPPAASEILDVHTAAAPPAMPARKPRRLMFLLVFVFMAFVFAQEPTPVQYPPAGGRLQSRETSGALHAEDRRLCRIQASRVPRGSEGDPPHPEREH